MLLITSSSSMGLGGFRQFIVDTDMTPTEYLANHTMQEIITTLKFTDKHVAQSFSSNQIESTSNVKFYSVPKGVELRIRTLADDTIDVLIQDLDLLKNYSES